uniref:Flavodoxin-like domain-containing protein n=2 Tax=Eucampia antarctica TaxID=49252 RepID=A0A7S2W3I4_9STRA|mmetsp:Transcript_18687/g.17999  ORF Transcript_18687/g.17999 Transcript_18687/m.17999 type:complete len:248 (+) Transcript_18687:72-815(+)|eukprot:CAMPEP_0197827090 /NCGR_PEP_ID=MMETSP1437-20131217/3957_1 /TAXON_ID=49252 ORGANISM="Eucampia antarctica, Strain CCMP1452" /NCGR_SAMPLE_ID=MMETSP1437 /ASSEMBLY_ACC=CAM_ASM_001096 /LENGTH=247 /DNA_ID=CAMNT_0043427817 /DNA_START=71 /DNA_END=814 /DNA_ORIENTATION=+
MSSSSTTRSEEILVLYGSQTGNSEYAASTLANDAPDKLSNSSVSVTARHMQLDDFIEMERVKWPRLVVIVTSSYGVGQAPLGCYEFRKMCDAILTRQGNGASEEINGLLSGVTYAMIGLGDSKYLTFFQNPTQIDKAMTIAGAKRVGPLGKADASGTGNEEQSEIILRWTTEIWSELKDVLHTAPTDETAKILDGVRRRTAEFCSQVLEDWNGADDNDMNQTGFSKMIMIAIPVLIAIIVMMILNSR